MTELRPMQLGEIIDRSAAFWRGHWKKLYGLFFAFSLAQYALLHGADLIVRRIAPAARGGAAAMTMMKDNPGEAMRQMGIGISGYTVAFLIVLFVTLVETSAATRYVMPAFLGQPAEVASGVRHALKRLGTLAGLFCLAMGWALLVLILALLPGIALMGTAAVVSEPAVTVALLVVGMLLALLGTVVWFLWFFIRFAVWGQVVAMEDVGALAAFRRCDALTSGRIGPGLLGFVKVRLTVLITVIALLLFMIGLISATPSFIIQAVYGNIFDPMHADPDAVPVALLVPAELFNIAVQCVVAPLYVAFQVVFYVDMRTRREGLDLELKLQGAL